MQPISTMSPESLTPEMRTLWTESLKILETPLYRSSKGGGTFKVLHIACDTYDLTPVVVYQNLEHNTIWTQPAKIWLSPTPIGAKRYVPIEGLNDKT